MSRSWSGFSDRFSTVFLPEKENHQIQQLQIILIYNLLCCPTRGNDELPLDPLGPDEPLDGGGRLEDEGQVARQQVLANHR